jgi:formylglycine-generating enzyme required for sulfatase activity
LSQDLSNPKYQFQRRSGPEREEGIKPLERSGAYLDLVSVLLDAPAPLAGLPSTLRGKDGKEMVLVPAGRFWLGCNDRGGKACRTWEGPRGEMYDTCISIECVAAEKPGGETYLDAFHIDRYEVSVGEYRTFLRATGHRALPDWAEKYAPGEDHPAVGVDWEDATAYCRWAEKRLPTEAEWEKAARGTDGRQYPWGNEPVDGRRANYCDRRCDQQWKDASQDDGYQYTAPVGSYPAGVSPYRVHDMAGNVCEWTSSLDKPYPYKADDGREDPKASERRVLRGGSWILFGTMARASNRISGRPEGRHGSVGFRCGKTP